MESTIAVRINSAVKECIKLLCGLVIPNMHTARKAIIPIINGSIFLCSLIYENMLKPEKYSISTDATSANPEIVRILTKSLCEWDVVTSISLMIPPIVHAP